jgi:hypothetical protein
MKRTVLALMFFVGCGGDQREMGHKKEPYPLDQVPENIRKIAEEELKGSKIMDAFKKSSKDGKFISYEIRAKNPQSGKINEVGIAPDGKVVDRE